MSKPDAPIARIQALADEHPDAKAELAGGLVHVTGTDPLGYDTSDLMDYARQVAQDALAGRHEDAVREELARISPLFLREAVRVQDLSEDDSARIQDARVETEEPYTLDDIPETGKDETNR